MNEYVLEVVATEGRLSGNTKRYHDVIAVIEKNVVEACNKLRQRLEEKGFEDIKFTNISKL